MLWYRLEALTSAECGLLWCLSIGHIQYLSFCRSLTSVILRNRAPIVEKSKQIILMMKNTVNGTVKYIMLQFKTAVFYVNIYKNIIDCCDQSWIFSIISPVFSVTWSFRNHTNMLVKKHFWLLWMLKTVVMLYIYVENVILFSLG